MDVQLKFQQLEKEMLPYKAIMSKASDTVMEQDVSKYPIFVTHKQTIDIGLKLVDPKNTSGKWSVNVSTLEEFVTRQLIQMDKLEEFKKVYKNPAIHLCLFILSDLGATFVFIPRE